MVCRPGAAAGARALNHLGGDAAAIHLNAIRVVMASPANVALFPMQDVLGLDHRARMNVPGTPDGNWRWRLQLPASKRRAVSRRLRLWTEAFDRAGSQGSPDDMQHRRLK